MLVARKELCIEGTEIKSGAEIPAAFAEKHRERIDRGLRTGKIAEKRDVPMAPKLAEKPADKPVEKLAEKSAGPIAKK